jgi:hypothetical protein
MSVISTLDDDIDRLSGSDTTSYVDADKHSSMTRWAHTIQEEVVDAQDDWDFNGETAVANLVANQREYTFPTTLLKVKRIELCFDGINWVEATLFNEGTTKYPLSSETNITNSFTNAQPMVQLFDKGFYIYSGTIIAVTGGIKIWFSDDIIGTNVGGTTISSFTADTDTPNLVEFAQQGLVYGAILDFATKNNLDDLVQKMNNRLYGNSLGRPTDNMSIGGLLGRIKNYYGSRNENKQNGVKPAYDLNNFE